ncbi:MAG: class I SAM-dependent methyltransferase [Candidatus Riflebacteria bacterium]|nr:class I SAM-dependent methyltransferase [Candidatus Riflebacteria bacterium]
MPNLNIEPIRDFYRHSWAQNYGDTSAKETPEFWDTRAADFAAKAHSPEARQETLEFLQRFEWRSDERVLDVATGPGTFAIPLARMVKEITVTDFSASMLEQLQKQAVSEKVGNLNQIHGRWLDIEPPGVFDTVLCLNSLGVISTDSGHQPQLAEALQRLRDATGQRLIVLIPHADSPLNREMRSLLELEELSLERLRVAVLYFAMVDSGMLPDLQIIKRPFRWTFTSIDEARETLLVKGGVKDGQKFRDKFDAYLKTALQQDAEGRLCLSYQVSQALYVWNR